MPRWIPTAKWEGRDVFIIGGGDSLRKFDWNLLKDECTVGCNTAFALGVEVCKVCIFGDAKWFKKYKNKLEKYEGVLFTNVTELQHSKCKWLWTLPRKAKGLSTTRLGWNTNTGGAAINLALILGAKRVFLLGFDMQLSAEGRPNWHNLGLDEPAVGTYEKFCEGFERIVPDLRKTFPGREIINVTDNSNLYCFPRIGCEQFWNERKKETV